MNIIVLFIVVVMLLIWYRYQHMEQWVPYKSCPFLNWETSPNHMVFYPRKRYRKPYSWPYTFESSYPLKHQRHFEEKY
jgi:hypothetical protein